MSYSGRAKARKAALFLPRLLLIYLYLYPVATILIAASILTSLLAYTTVDLYIGIISLALSLASLYRVLDLRKMSLYLRKGSISEQPRIIVNVRAPITEFGPISWFRPVRNQVLGDRPVGIAFELTVFLHNLGKREAVGLRLTLEAPPEFEVEGGTGVDIGELGSGAVARQIWTLTPTREIERESEIAVTARWQYGSAERRLKVRSCFRREESPPISACIERWPNGARAAVAWRGDLDGLGELTNIENLKTALKWAGFYRVPPSLFISGRLNLDFEAWKEWCEHFPGKYQGEPTRENFQRYINFLSGIEARNRLQYPLLDDPWPCAQIGNHMYYHYYSRYGYDASPDTSWKSYVSPGEHDHSWERSKDSDSLSEIRDNLEINGELIERTFGVRPTTWSAPADKPHPLYPAALQATGIQGASESYPAHNPKIPLGIAPYRPELGETTPFHPPGTGVVETGAHVYKHDPHTVNQTVSLKKAVIRAVKRRSQVTFLIHPHLRQPQRYGGRDSVRHFQEVLRFLVEDLGPSAWITTHHWITEYWEAVLCPEHRKVKCVIDGDHVRAENSGNEDIAGVPVDVEFENGKRACFLIDLFPHSSIEVLG